MPEAPVQGRKRAHGSVQPDYINFREWLMRYIDRDVPRGDLARDIIADPGWPQTDSLYVMQQHLATMVLPSGARRELRLAWRSYLDQDTRDILDGIRRLQGSVDALAARVSAIQAALGDAEKPRRKPAAATHKQGAARVTRA